MAVTAAAPSQAHLDVALGKIKTEGVSQEESDQFVQGLINELDKDSDQGQLAKNVSEVAEWANDIRYNFSASSHFPQRMGGIQPTMATHLSLSRDVASQQAAILQRFDKVFLEIVKSIKTDQDREDAIVELESFANEDNSEPERMAEGFRTLKDDIEDFVVRFDAWVQTTSTELKQQAQELQKVIENLRVEIQELDIRIMEATAALLGSAAAIETFVGLVGVIVSGTILALALAQRVDKTITLSNKRKELAEVNRQQEALAHVKTAFDGLKPDIALICQNYHCSAKYGHRFKHKLGHSKKR
ncbi:hypothetical protein RHS01_08613 [Rhizoctonia solani]|uniref:Uncharacterized protein n=1 Tax=Rhizoctonia solani TaxID=456999 RepID=A0A8H7I9F3_9AGAM|nr:hypothetical protein RHS01_08613 [Rhizoctonia solani]